METNTRFILTCAIKYKGRGLDVDDLFQEGSRGLIRAVESFDSGRKVNFLTYAVWWVRQSIRTALREKGRMIRIPSNRFEKIKTRNPKETQAANEARLDEIYRLSNLARLDAPIDGREFSITDPEPTPTDSYEESQTKANIEALVKSLPDRLRLIISFRFGLFGSKPETLEEVAERLSLTRERVRQLQNDAEKILKLRAKQFHIERLP